MEEEEIIYCEWCGEREYHIAIYENDAEEETAICKECYNSTFR